MRFWPLFARREASEAPPEGSGFRADGTAPPLVARTTRQTATDIPKIRRRRRIEVVWRSPTDEDRRRFGEMAGGFADFFEAVAEVNDETWLIYSRPWFGFPDPPQFVVVFLSAEGAVIAAEDFDQTPRAWDLPEGFG